MSKLPVLFSMILCLSLAGTLAAQRTISIGPRLGFNSSTIVGDDVEADANTALVFGLTSTYSINEKTGLGLDMLYSREGAESEVGDVNTKLDYLRIPVTFQFFFRGWEDDFRPKIYAGFVPGFLLSAESGDDDVKDAFNSFDLAGTVGLGFNYRLGDGTRGVWLNTDLRYLRGLTTVFENENIDAYNQSLQLSVGVAFGISGE